MGLCFVGAAGGGRAVCWVRAQLRGAADGPGSAGGGGAVQLPVSIVLAVGCFSHKSQCLFLLVRLYWLRGRVQAVGTWPGGGDIPGWSPRGRGCTAGKAAEKYLTICVCSGVTRDPHARRGEDQLLITVGVWEMGSFLATPLKEGAQCDPSTGGETEARRGWLTWLSCDGSWVRRCSFPTSPGCFLLLSAACKLLRFQISE